MEQPFDAWSMLVIRLFIIAGTAQGKGLYEYNKLGNTSGSLRSISLVDPCALLMV